MSGLTPTLAKLLAFLREYSTPDGVMPTYREMAAHLGSGTSTTYKLINGLIDRGYVRRTPRRTRALELVDRLPADEAPTPVLISVLERRGYQVLQRAA